MAAENRYQQILAKAVDSFIVEPSPGSARPDLVIQTRDGRTIPIEIKWAAEGWPQDVRRAARNMPDPWPANVVLLAHRLSPEPSSGFATAVRTGPMRPARSESSDPKD